MLPGLPETIFAIERQRNECARGGPQPWIEEIEAALSEDVGWIVIFYRIGDNWYGTGFAPPLPLDSKKFDADFYEAEVKRRLLEIKTMH